MHFKVLGRLSAPSVDGPVSALPPKPRTVLSLLVLNIGNVTYVDDLVDEVWGEDPPVSALTTLQTYIYRLRRVLGPVPSSGPILTRPQGYLLEGRPEEIDMFRFVAEVEHARRVVDDCPDEAGRAVRRALEMWRGPAFGDVRQGLRLRAQAERLDEMRHCAVELLIRSGIVTGQYHEMVVQLRSLVSLQPYNELLHGYLMFSLAASGRRYEALKVYAELRTSMRERLGIEPSDALVRLHREVLSDDAMTLPFAETR